MPANLLNFRVWLAAILLLVSLGLPWGTTSNFGITSITPGYYIAGYCRTIQTWDGWYTSECDPGTFGSSLMNYSFTQSTTYGAQHSGRFGVAAGLVLIFLAYRLRRPRYLMFASFAVACLNVLTAGLGFGFSGSSIAWIASVLLLSCCLGYRKS